MKTIKKMNNGGMSNTVVNDPPEKKKTKREIRKIKAGRHNSNVAGKGLGAKILKGLASVGTTIAGAYAAKKLEGKQKGGPIKKKLVKAQNGTSVKSDPPKTKSFTNPLTGRTRVTEGWKEKSKTTGTVAPRPGYAEKTVDVYNKKGDKIKTVNKTRELVQQAKGDGFIRRGRDLWDYDKKVTKHNKKG
jgi:hypothetical protein